MSYQDGHNSHSYAVPTIYIQSEVKTVNDDGETLAIITNNDNVSSGSMGREEV